MLSSICSNLRGYRREDLAIIYLAVPAILILIWAAPPLVREALIFRPKSPEPWAYITSNYVHYDLWSHLMPNLGAYLAVSSACMVLERRGRFMAMSAYLLVGAPILSSVWAEAIFSGLPDVYDISIFGFSTTVFGYMGYLVFLLSKTASGLLRGMGRRRRSGCNGQKWMAVQMALFTALFVPGLAIIGLQNPWGGEIMTNTAAHFLGFASGGMAPFAYEFLTAWLGIRSSQGIKS